MDSPQSAKISRVTLSGQFGVPHLHDPLLVSENQHEKHPVYLQVHGGQLLIQRTQNGDMLWIAIPEKRMIELEDDG